VKLPDSAPQGPSLIPVLGFLGFGHTQRAWASTWPTPYSDQKKKRRKEEEKRKIGKKCLEYYLMKAGEVSYHAEKNGGGGDEKN